MQTSPASPQMQSETVELPKITATRAREVCRAFELSEPGQRLLDDRTTPLQFVSRLIEIECFADAVSFLAHALPKREAVWWGCLCARDALAAEVSPAAMTALTAAEAWVYKPTEETRHAAGAAASAADTGSPCTWPAFAAFWAGADIAPQGSSIKIPPGQHMSAKAVVAAVALAATKHDRETAADNFQRYLAQAIDIAGGGSGRRPGRRSSAARGSSGSV
jgi:hypothetical protein